MISPAPRPRQGGQIFLLAALFTLLLAGSYIAYRATDASFSQRDHRAELVKTLQRAKEALIARAIADDNRPGSLPCPDLITNSLSMYNTPGDGRADMLAGNHCPAYLGWLPWLTLDLPELVDDRGIHLWYALSPSLRDDDSAQPINSDTPMALEVDGDTDIAAVVIAAGAPLPGQARPSNLAADYLDGDNGHQHKFVSRPAGPDFNDRLLVITRGELMAAVEKRIAGELRNCLEQHADASTNTAHRYPWAAPLISASFQGQAGSRFGRVPETQPGSGPQAALQTTRIQLQQARAQLAQSTNASAQQSALDTLSGALLRARNLFDVISLATGQLKQSADAASRLLQPLESTLAAAVANGQISPDEDSKIRTQGANSQATFNQLPALLGQFGIDAFPGELARRTARLALAGTPEQLASAALALEQFLAVSSTPRADIAPPLATATRQAGAAYAAALAAVSHPADNVQLNAAKSAAGQLIGAATQLREAVDASRVNVLSSEIGEYAGLLKTQVAALDNLPNIQNATVLGNALLTTERAISTLETGINDIIEARESATNALSTAHLAAQSSSPDYRLIAATSGQAIARIEELVTRISDNEKRDNNLSRTSLLADLANYQAALSHFGSIATAPPSPLLPYANTLNQAAGGIALWAGIISEQATATRLLAKNQEAAEDLSAYGITARAQNSITDNNGAAELLQTAIEHPTDEHATRVRAALAETGRLTELALDAAGQLAGSLTGTSAQALPTIWQARRCDFLRPGQNTWWRNNQWAKTLFFQIASPLKAAPGTLRVNDAGAFRLVVLASGRANPRQNRSTPTIANFLEGNNADPSRDGDGTMPIDRFSTAPPSGTFNDRLSY